MLNKAHPSPTLKGGPGSMAAATISQAALGENLMVVNEVNPQQMLRRSLLWRRSPGCRSARATHEYRSRLRL